MATPKKEKTVQGWKIFPKDPLGEARIWVSQYHRQNLSQCSTAATITVIPWCPNPCQGPHPAGAAPAEQRGQTAPDHQASLSIMSYTWAWALGGAWQRAFVSGL